MGEAGAAAKAEVGSGPAVTDWNVGVAAVVRADMATEPVQGNGPGC